MSDGLEAEPLTIIEQIRLQNVETAEILSSMIQGNREEDYWLSERLNEPIYKGWATCLLIFLEWYFASHGGYYKVILFLSPIVELEKNQLV